MSSRGVTDQVLSWLLPFGDTDVPSVPRTDHGCPVLGWAASGGMALTGHRDLAPLASPAPAYAALAAAGDLIAALTGRLGVPVRLDPGAVLAGRAALQGLTRQGPISVGGATRLLRCDDGWCAVSLARADDVELVPAILSRADVGDAWAELASMAESSAASEIAEHIQQFGVPAAVLPPEPPRVAAPWRVSPVAPTTAGLRLDGAMVVDLSSLWAGPLCAQILGHAGARIVKVESTRRPDGARSGNGVFYDWLHAGHESVAVDFTTSDGRALLGELIDAADIVIEASRPRALRQLGLAPEQLRHRAGKVWVSLTGYGRDMPTLAAFGDDAAVAGGLVGWHEGEPVFCADAVADPLTGVSAALAVAGSVASGGGHLLDLSMRDVAAAFACAQVPWHGHHPVDGSPGIGWAVRCPHHDRAWPVLPPRAPELTGHAAPIGADNEHVLAALR